MLRKVILKGTKEWMLPVTPKTYTVESGKDIQVLDVYEVGEYTIPANPTLQTIKVDAMLPADTSAFAAGQTQAQWIEWLSAAAKDHSKIRFVISGTDVNVPCYVQTVQYGEKDGTNDVYAALTLREYTTLDAVQVEARRAGDNAAREDEVQQTAETTYTVQDGDTMWAIAKKYYGDGSLCYKLAACNDIANANLIYTGQVLRIPAQGTLDATQATQATVSEGTEPTVKKEAQKAAQSLSVQYLPRDITRGIASYHWTDAKTCESKSGALPGTVMVPYGARVVLNWRGKNGRKCTGIILDGTPRQSSGALTLTMTAAHTLQIKWE